uniref:NADH:ubiquinone reductase (H(+)-translocating) n=1 Tax=Acrobeloides nanus TaxID=290746 RepID=A0A914EIJ5_9BILA
MSLSSCFSPNGAHFIPVSAIYSGIVSIIFFATYLTSLLLFTRHIAQTKNQQVHAQKQLSKYFNLTGSIFSLAGYLILLGAELNGCLNVLIYLMTHMEFKECSKKTISHCIAKPTIVGSNLVFLIAPNSTTRRS